MMVLLLQDDSWLQRRVEPLGSLILTVAGPSPGSVNREP